MTTSLPRLSLEPLRRSSFANDLRNQNGLWEQPRVVWVVHLITGSNNTIRGLVLKNFGGRDIYLNGSSNNVIENNFIGVAANGTTAAGNDSHGIALDTNASNNIIQNNRIAKNAGDGISLSDGTRNKISANEIFSNAGHGIDLNNDGVSTKDDDDADTGANATQNTSVLLVASPSNNDVVLKGRLNSLGNQNYTIEFFRQPRV